MRIYISGPITNVVDYKEKFARAEKKIKAMHPDAEIINPTMIELPSSCSHKDYMRIDFMLLDLADAIYMLDGWELSEGACMEYGYATAKDMIILEEQWEKDI